MFKSPTHSHGLVVKAFLIPSIISIRTNSSKDAGTRKLRRLYFFTQLLYQLLGCYKLAVFDLLDKRRF